MSLSASAIPNDDEYDGLVAGLIGYARMHQSERLGRLSLALALFDAALDFPVKSEMDVDQMISALSYAQKYVSRHLEIAERVYDDGAAELEALMKGDGFS